MDKAVKWLANYWAMIALVVMVLGSVYLSASNEKKTAELEASNGQTEIYLNK